MASVRDVHIDICQKDALGQIYLKLDFLEEECKKNQDFELFTALIEEYKDADVFLCSPLLTLGTESHTEEALFWVDSRSVRPNGLSTLSITIDCTGQLHSLDDASVYRAVVYLIPKVKTEIAWSEQLVSTE